MLIFFFNYRHWLHVLPTVGAMASIFLIAPTQSYAQSAGTTAGKEEAGDGEDAPTFAAIPLGDYRIREVHPTLGLSTVTSFSLSAKVGVENQVRFEKRLENRKNKLRDQVMVAIRTTPIEEFDEPDLRRLRRRITVRLGRTLPILKFEELLITQFSFVVER